MPYKIKSRLVDISKTQVDLMLELKEKGIATDPPSLSMAIRGRRGNPAAEKLLAACDEIVTKWESEVKPNA